MAALALVALAGPPDPPSGDADPKPPRAGYAPDPASPASRKQWVFDVDYRDGKARVTGMRAIELARPVSTPRIVGRFAIELWIGRELVDRVRLTGPLAVDPSDRPRPGPGRRPIVEDVRATLRIQMADNPRATWAQLVDRATGEVTRLPWPPKPPDAPRDGGPPDATAPEAGPDASAPRPTSDASPSSE